MKTIALFAALLTLGWTTLAGGVIAALAGEPAVTSHRHDHAPAVEPAPVRNVLGDPCLGATLDLDASVPCPA